MVNKISSYTSANTLPVKLFLNEGARELRPVHINWYPTNACNLSCQFCLCAKRDKSLSMDIGIALRVIRDFADLGCKAVTISGGGEPLLHPFLANMISEFHQCGIKIGMVTNGTRLHGLERKTLELLEWCRISCSCPFTEEYMRILDRAVEAEVDWAFSCVVGVRPDYANILEMVKYAELHGFTHVRLVGDMKQPGRIDWSGVKRILAGRDDLVIYQDRKTSVESHRCLLGYVRPVIAPDWSMYLCNAGPCAMRHKTLDNPSELYMGDARQVRDIYAKTKDPFRVMCAQCDYELHNSALEAMTSEIAHKDFV